MTRQKLSDIIAIGTAKHGCREHHAPCRQPAQGACGQQRRHGQCSQAASKNGTRILKSPAR